MIIVSEDNEVRFREADEEYQRLKADFARIARAKRMTSHSRSDSSRSSSPLGRQSQRRAMNLPKFRIATFYASDVELWFNQIETQFALHQINDDDERYSLTCAALSGEVASDVRDVPLQPFRSNKYESLKAILIERRGLTTPERVNKVISGEKIGNDIPSRFLRRLQKTAGFGTKAVVGKAVIRQAFIRQMPASIRAHLATQPDSATLESLAVLADRALAAEEDVEESKPGVAEIKVEETTKLVGLLEDLSRRIKKLETVTTSERKRNKGRGRANNNYAPAPAFAPNVQASGFVSNQPSHYSNEQNNAPPFVPPPNAQATEFVYESNNCTNAQQNVRPFAPPPQTLQNNVAQPTDTATAQICYYHQTYGEKVRLCSEPCSYYVTLGQREVANIALSHSKLLYVADKGHKCRYLIDTGAAVSVLPKSCANGISDADSLPLVAANNSTIHTYGTGKRVVDVGLKREYPWTFIVADVQHLGHHVCAEGISPLPSAVDAIVNFVKPEKQRALRRYLGMVNYYHRFIPHCAAKLTPLNNLLTAANEGHTRLSPKSNFDFESAFSESKQILANATLLVHPDSTAQINITCDASDVAVGGVLQQFLNGMWQPLSFFSKKLNPAETRYSAFDRKLLAVYATIKHFRHN